MLDIDYPADAKAYLRGHLPMKHIIPFLHSGTEGALGETFQFQQLVLQIAKLRGEYCESVLAG